MASGRTPPPSCQGLALASTSFVASPRANVRKSLRKMPPAAGKLVDGRAEPGHDEEGNGADAVFKTGEPATYDPRC
jgi:hypothetical protein